MSNKDGYVVKQLTKIQGQLGRSQAQFEKLGTMVRSFKKNQQAWDEYNSGWEERAKEVAESWHSLGTVDKEGAKVVQSQMDELHRVVQYFRFAELGPIVSRLEAFIKEVNMHFLSEGDDRFIDLPHH